MTHLNMTTTVEKGGLVERVRQNRDEHEAKYNEAVEAFWVKAQKFVTATIAKVERRDPAFLALAGGRSSPVFGGFQAQALLGVLGIGGESSMPAPPPCHLESYDQALEMIRMHTEDTIELEAEDFSRLVLDNWDWKGSFMGSYSALTG